MASSLAEVASDKEPVPPAETAKSLAPPPALPARLADPTPVVYIGIIGWFAAFCGLLVARYVFDVGPPIWLWTALAGTALGIIGFLIMRWQRAASRRGYRGAQRGL